MEIGEVFSFKASPPQLFKLDDWHHIGIVKEWKKLPPRLAKFDLLTVCHDTKSGQWFSCSNQPPKISKKGKYDFVRFIVKYRHRSHVMDSVNDNDAIGRYTKEMVHKIR